MRKAILEHKYQVKKEDREILHGHKSFLLWFTGLSGSGKSTLANLVEIALNNKGLSTYTLDGDNIRQTINKDLSFTSKDRSENIRRIAEISNLMLDAGVITLAAFVSPFIKDRELVKQIIGPHNFIEIFVNTSLAECERRDVKGLYQKARTGEINNFTGISSLYEKPLNPDIEIKTEHHTEEKCVQLIIDFVSNKLS
jgi:adenylylsulfate kinase